MNIVLLDAHEVGADGRVRLDGSRAVHILTLLNVVPGQEIRIGMINGPRGAGRIDAIGDTSLEMVCRFEDVPPEPPSVDIVLALPRPKVMKRLWAQLAALGVRRIILTNAAKVERNYFDTHWIDPRHYQSLLREGLSQCGDTRLPAVSVQRRLKPFLETDVDDLFPDGPRLIAHPRTDALLSDLNLRQDQPVLVAVGPEGGWTDYELNMFAEHGFKAISMGSRTLRTDTACVALLGALNAQRAGRQS